jgi:hypothetical protein
MEVPRVRRPRLLSRLDLLVVDLEILRWEIVAVIAARSLDVSVH